MDLLLVRCCCHVISHSVAVAVRTMLALMAPPPLLHLAMMLILPDLPIIGVVASTVVQRVDASQPLPLMTFASC